MTFWITCPIPGCGKVYQSWGDLRTKEDVERSFRSHLTGKHNLSGEDYKRAYESAKRQESK